MTKSHGSKRPAPIWIRSCSIARQIHVVYIPSHVPMLPRLLVNASAHKLVLQFFNLFSLGKAEERFSVQLVPANIYQTDLWVVVGDDNTKISILLILKLTLTVLILQNVLFRLIKRYHSLKSKKLPCSLHMQC